MKDQMVHSWQTDIKQAKIIQEKLAHQIKITKLPSAIKKIAGFDVSYLKSRNIMIGGMVVMNIPALEVVETRIESQPISFPYIPGFLSFREAPVLLRVIGKQEENIDVFLFDGHGQAHPRGLGIASHIGVLLDKPTLGCAKKRLVGVYDPPADNRGACSDLTYRDKIIGKVLRTRPGIKPIFVSVGHRANLLQGIRLIMSCCTKYRIPEPLRRAHGLVTAARNKIEQEGISIEQIN
jgi:deoxyribonuclease V